MTRIIVQSIGDMPGEAKDGLPLGCVLDDTLGPTVVAYGEGSTFSTKGLALVDPNVRTYVAYFDSPMFSPDANDDPSEPIIVQAMDIHAVLMWLREHYNGSFSLHVTGASTYLGKFQS